MTDPIPYQKLNSDWQQLTPDQVRTAYRMMLLIRRFEEKTGQLYAFGVIADEIKLSIGREALITGLMMAREPDDPIVVGRRFHGHMLALGVSPLSLMEKLAGQGGAGFELASCLQIRPGRVPNFFRTNNSTEGVLQTAASLALLRQHQGSIPNIKSPCVTFATLDGDATDVECAQRHLAFAKRLRLPIVYLIDQAVAVGEGSEPGAPVTISKSPDFGQLGLNRVDGIDVRKVRHACAQAATLARSGAGPQGLLISTQAFRGHGPKPSGTGGSPTSHHITSDPILVMRTLLEATVGETPEDIALIERDVRELVNAAGKAVRNQVQSALA